MSILVYFQVNVSLGNATQPHFASAIAIATTAPFFRSCFSFFWGGSFFYLYCVEEGRGGLFRQRTVWFRQRLKWVEVSRLSASAWAKVASNRHPPQAI